MKFEIIKSGKIKNAEECYFINEQSFDCVPVTNIDINIAMAYLNLGIDSEDMCVKCIWGFSPRESWEKMELNVPLSEEGRLRLVGEYEAGLTWRIDKDKMWDSYFDESSGWYCLGTPVIEEGDESVKIIMNMIAVVNNMNLLKAIWIKPEFV